jgi:hypothetical protein
VEQDEEVPVFETEDEIITEVADVVEAEDLRVAAGELSKKMAETQNMTPLHLLIKREMRISEVRNLPMISSTQPMVQDVAKHLPGEEGVEAGDGDIVDNVIVKMLGGETAEDRRAIEILLAPHQPLKAATTITSETLTTSLTTRNLPKLQHRKQNLY